MSKFIEAEIGEVVKFGDESYICVKDDPETLCSECAFYCKLDCIDYVCSGSNRKDKYNVHFVEQEGGKE